MSHEQDKFKKSKRLHTEETSIQKQVQLAKNYGYHKLSSTMNKWRYITEPHRNHKKHIFNCGDPKCHMCGNPRKFFNQKTMQEKRFEQDMDNARDRHSNGLPPKDSET
jgi:hypothetical protein